MALSVQRQKFCEYYVASGNATESAIKAGYSPRSAMQNSSRLLRNAEIQEYIRKLNEEARSNRIMTMLEVQEFWSETIRDDKNRIADRLKASELLARAKGLFLDKIEITNDNPFSGLTTEELKRLANGKD